MAKRIEVRVTDDLDNSPDAQRIVFVHEGVLYEIDLSDANLDTYNKMMASYVENGRKLLAGNGRPAKMELKQYESPVRAVPTVKPAKATKPATVDKEQRRNMREWWVTNWMHAELPEPSAEQVTGRAGRIPRAVQEAYHKHGGGKVPAQVPASEEMETTTGGALATAAAVKAAIPAQFQPAETPGTNGKVARKTTRARGSKATAGKAARILEA